MIIRRPTERLVISSIREGFNVLLTRTVEKLVVYFKI